MAKPISDLLQRVLLIVCVWLGMPPDTAASYVALAVLVLGAVVDVYFRRKQASLSIEAVHRAAELPAQSSTPTDLRLLATLRKLGITPRDLHVAWERCKSGTCDEDDGAGSSAVVAPFVAVVAEEVEVDDSEPITLVD